MFHLFHNICWTTSNDGLFVQNLFDYQANAVTGLEWNLFEVCRRVIVFHIISITFESHEQSNLHNFLSFFFLHLNVYNVLLFLNNRSNILKYFKNVMWFHRTSVSKRTFSSDFLHQNGTIYNPQSEIFLVSIIFTSTWSARCEVVFCNLLLKGEKQEEEPC